MDFLKLLFWAYKRNFKLSVLKYELKRRFNDLISIVEACLSLIVVLFFVFFVIFSAITYPIHPIYYCIFHRKKIELMRERLEKNDSAINL